MTTDARQIIALTADELDALYGVGPLAFTLYILLRGWMDYGTGIVGRSRPISLSMLATYAETHTPKGQGVQIERPSERNIRTALDRLVRAGLLKRLSGDRLAYYLPMALVASSRPNQTRRGAVRTKPARSGPIREKATSNPAHIMSHENQTLRPPAVDNLGRRARPTAEGLAAGNRPGHQRDADRARLLQIGHQRGIEARPGESWRDYRRRVFQCRESGALA